MLSNPPYGKSWKTDAEKMGGKKEILDSRFNTYLENGEQLSMLPRASDGQLLFLLNNIAKMKKDTEPYSDYQSIALPWLNRIPSHWNIIRNKNIFIEKKRTVGSEASSYTLLSLTINGIIPRDIENAKGKFPSNFDTYKTVSSGDMVFCLFDIDETPRTVGLSTYDGMLTGAYTIVTVSNCNRRFPYYYYLALDNAKALKPLYTGLRKTINISTFLGTCFPLPPNDEQDQIVRYLDWQVSKINKLIEGKRKKRSILLERKKIIILEALTGVSLKVPETKPVFLHRERTICIPSHWDTKPLCAIAKIKSIPNNTDLDLLSVYLDEGVVPFSSRSEKRTNATSKDLSKYQRVDPGDFVMNNQQAWRGSVGVSDYTGIVSPAYVVLSLDETLSRGFANYLLRSPLMVEQYLVGSKGVGSIQRNVYWPTIKRAAVIVPPMEEQLEIEQIIRKQTEMIDSVCKAIDSEIELLQEMKNKLISDVVTGQIDVRGIEIPEYEYVEETIDGNIDVDEDTSQEVDES